MSQTVRSQRRPRRYDPERRTRIAEAALRVIARDGLEGLTHRAVAAAADVPVGSTTYHFADKDELLLAAIDLAANRGAAELDTVFEACKPSDDLAGAIASWLRILLSEYEDELSLHYEMFLAARRRPALRGREPLIPDSYLMLRPYVDEPAARVLTDVIEGVLARSVVFGQPFDDKELRDRITRLLTT